MRALRYVAAVIAGVVVAGLVVFAVELVGHAVYPPPLDLDFTDRAQIEAYVQSLPLPAFAFVMAAWALGALFGGVIAALIAPGRKMLFASIVGAFVLTGVIANLAMVPHPPWFALSAPLVVLGASSIAANVGARLMRRRRA